VHDALQDAHLKRLLRRVFMKMPCSFTYARAVALFDSVIETEAAVGENPAASAVAQDKANAVQAPGGSPNLQEAMRLYDRAIAIRRPH
jgi:hypothetical protein